MKSGISFLSVLPALTPQSETQTLSVYDDRNLSLKKMEPTIKRLLILLGINFLLID